MKKTMFKVISAMMISSMILSGCGAKLKETVGNKPGTSTSKYDESNQTEPGTFPIVKKPQTLTMLFTKPGYIGELKSNDGTKWLEKKLGINLEFNEMVDAEGAEQKIALMLASGEKLPDILFTSKISVAQIENFGNQGTFIPINEFIDKWGVNLKKMNAHNPNILKSVTSLDGKIYGYPSYGEGLHGQYPQKAWVNKKWLDAYGLKVPETTEEFEKMLTTFKEKGKKDVVPMAGVTDAWGNDLFGYLINPFQPSSGDNNGYIYLNNGKVDVAYTKDGFKDGIKYIRGLYTKGLLDPEAFIMKKTQIKALTGDQNGNRVGAFLAGHLGLTTDISKPGARDQYIAIPPLKDKNGNSISPHQPVGAGLDFFISKDCKDPITAFRIADAMATNANENIEWRNFFDGPENVGWRKAKDGEMGLDGKAAKWSLLYPWGSQTNIFWGAQVNKYTLPEDKGTLVSTSSGYDNEKILWDVTKNIYQPKSAEIVLPSVTYTKDEASEMADINVELAKYVSIQKVAFATGKIDVDKEWSNFQKKLTDLKLPRFLEIIQKAYDRQYKK